MRKLGTFVLLGLALVAAPAFSAERGFYVTADAGLSRGEGQFRGGSATNYVRSDRDDDATAFRVRVGYQFVRFIGVEVGYVNLGDFDYVIGPGNCPPAIPTNCDFTTHTSSHGPIANAVFMLPIGERVRLKARLGVYHAQYKTRESGPNASANPRRGTDSELGGQYSVGAGFRVTDKLEIEVTYSRFGGPGWVEMGAPGPAHFAPGDVDVGSVGVLYKFW